MTADARSALELARRDNPGIGDAPVFPAPKDPSKPISRHLTRDWWKRGEKLAKLEHKRGRGWHSLRRKFASDLKGVPLKTLQERGLEDPPDPPHVLPARGRRRDARGPGEQAHRHLKWA